MTSHPPLTDVSDPIGHIMVLGSGPQAEWEPALRRLASAGPLLLIDKDSEPWQAPIVADARRADPLSPTAVLRAVGDLSRTYQIDDVINFSSHHAPAAALVRQELAHASGGGAGNSPPRPSRMDTAQLLAQAGVEHSSPRLASTYEQAVDIAHHVGFPLVCKPDVPRQHFAARIATDLGQLATAFAAASEAFQVGTGGVVEPFLQGIEATAYTYSTSGRSHIVAISHATFDPQAEPALVPIELVVDGGDVCVGAVEDIALQALQAVGHHNGPAQLRLRLTATGPRVISIARQLPDPLVCLLIEEATGTDIISAAATHCRDRTMNLSGTPQGAAAIRYLQLTASVAAEPAADQNVTGHATPFAYVTRYHAGRQVGPVLRYGYVHVIGADYPQSIARLRSSVSDLRPARATA